MSAFFGILAAHGRPVELDELEAMESAIAYCGSGEVSHSVDGSVALGCMRAASGPPMPLRHGPTGVAVTARARLDNRDELYGLLEVPTDRWNEISDGELILEAYLRWGEGCPEHLLGDWSFAIWDPRDAKLVAARDHAGTIPFYYHSDDSAFSFCSSIKGLLALPWIAAQPNLLHVAKILTTWPTDGVLTSYENVFRLPSGNLLVAKDGNVHVRRYWTPGLDRTLKLGSESEYVDAFLELYSEAVRCRMRGSTTVGVTLSGGLDSGSVCALAARELRLRDASLHAFTSAPMFECGLNSTKFADESPFVEANRELMGNLLLQYVRAEGISPLAGIDRALDLLDDPIHGASNAYWIVGILQAAQVAGVDMLLTGAMGNTTVSWKGDRYGTLRGKARKYLLLSWAKPIRDGLRRLARRDPEAWLAGSPLNPGFATSLDIYRRKKEEGYDPNSVVSRNVCQARLDGIKVSLRVLGAHFSEFGAGYGMESADPTSDKRIIEFCLAIPSEIFRSDDMDRRLVRLAMKGLLPDQVRLNRRRGLQAADLRLRLLATMPEILDALDQLERHPLSREVLDLAKMKRVADQLGHRSDPEMTTHAGAVLMRGLMAGRLLTRF